MSTAEVPEFVSVDEYLSSEKKALSRSEYVDGWVRAMSGATNRHNRVKGNCFVQLSNILRGKRCQPYDSDTKIRIRKKGQTRFYYPDVQVVCESNAPTDVFQDRPVLIIEVLSPSTRQYDLDEKLAVYLEIATLEGYIILEQHTPVAIVMRQTSNGFLRETYQELESEIPLQFLECSLSLHGIYEGIEFIPTCVQEAEMEYEIL